MKLTGDVDVVKTVD